MFYVDVQNTFSYILLKAYTFTAITGGLKKLPQSFLLSPRNTDAYSTQTNG